MNHLVLTVMFLSVVIAGLTRESSGAEYATKSSSASSMGSKSFQNAIDSRTMSKPSNASQEGYKHISPEDAYQRIKSGENIILLDVRTPEESAARRIPGSILIPIEPVDMVSKDVEAIIPQKNVPVFIYCRSGRRSVDAAKILVELEYTDVYNLGGINSWPYETIKTDEVDRVYSKQEEK